ncbi:dynamin family protein [Alicyclobacillus ferrooxydans]|uniref:dynamin family protein n=1 Tax=Alicyclobacillus ferrooxydans TaxID=471514 RepID=UPI0009FB1309|nr:dynamin family protein [Alicyclobacillus ferrooxydans]
MTSRESGIQETVKIDSIYSDGLARLAVSLDSDGEHEAAGRIQDLRERLESSQDTVRIALCGLFSAGKSSLINALVGDRVAATGAIPTTAAIQEVLWDTGTGRILLMDTPGIDSTDEAHQEATEAALHLADVVCLVVDYQHVESEENLEFARVLCQRGVRLIVVVHQIDKHLEFELSFNSFSRRVETALEDYGISYDKLFYTAVRETPLSQLDAFRGYLTDLSRDAHNVIAQGILNNTNAIVRDAVAERYADEIWQAEQQLQDEFGEVPLDRQEAVEWLDDLNAKIDALEAEANQREHAIRDAYEAAAQGFHRSIDLGQIAPYDTTELGRHFVESLRKGFKVGWMNAKKKTEEEQQRRLQGFHKQLQDHLRQSLVWPLQREIRSFVYGSDFADESFVTDLDALDMEIPTELFYTAVHQGALESAQYPYQYVKDVVSRVKTLVRVKLNELIAPWLEQMLAKFHSDEQERLQQISDVKTHRDALVNWQNLHQQEEELLETYMSQLNQGAQA